MSDEWHRQLKEIREAVAAEVERRRREGLDGEREKQAARDKRAAAAERRARQMKRTEKRLKRLVMKRLALAVAADGGGDSKRRRPTNRRKPRAAGIAESAVKPWMIDALRTTHRKPRASVSIGRRGGQRR